MIRRVLLILLWLPIAALCLCAVATMAWATWVFAAGDGWLLDLMLSRPPVVAFTLLCSVSGILACLSFWVARVVFRKVMV
jgi:hypothetical protein